MRGIAASVATALLAMMIGSSAEAVDVQVEGFTFGCTTPDGEVRKPKFGDVDGMYFTNLPEERKPCLQAIDRMIYSCTANTIFISPDLNDRFPDCLEVFEQQAQRCVRHFEDQRHVCDAGSSSMSVQTSDEPEVAPTDLTMWVAKRSNVRSGPGTDHAKVGLLEIGDEVRVTGEVGDWFRIEAPDGGDAFVWAPLLTEDAPSRDFAAEAPGRICDHDDYDEECWREIKERPNCYLWYQWSSPTLPPISWSGSCPGGAADGTGTLVNDGTDLYFTEIVTYVSTITIQDGKVHGRFIGEETSHGDVYTGEYVSGKAHGPWIFFRADGSCRVVVDYLEGLRQSFDEDCREYAATTGANLQEQFEAILQELENPFSETDAAGSGPLQGSIAFSQESDGGYAWGIAWSFDSRSDALTGAVDQCQAYGGSDCVEVGWFEEACGALAIGDENGYGTGWGATIAAAERDALAQCRAVNQNCRVEVARCSQSQEAGGQGRRPEEDTVVADVPAEEEPASVVIEPMCRDGGPYWDCWVELSNATECHAFVRENGYTWLNDELSRQGLSGTPMDWSGACPDGAAEGEGTVTGTWGPFEGSDRVEHTRASGAFSKGVLTGHWNLHFRVEVYGDAHEFQIEGLYEDGLLEGDWISIQSSSDGTSCE